MKRIAALCVPVIVICLILLWPYRSPASARIAHDLTDAAEPNEIQAGTKCLQVLPIDTMPADAYLPAIVGGKQSKERPSIISVSEDTDHCLLFVGDRIHFSLEANEQGGFAKVDIGFVHKDIRLYDDGTHGDSSANDGVYERTYVAQQRDITRNAQVVGHFTSSDGVAALTRKAEGTVTITDWDSGETSIAPVLEDSVENETGAQYATRRILVTVSENTSFDKVLETLEGYDVLLASWIADLNIFEIESAADQDYDELSQALLLEPGIEAVERNYLFEPLGKSIVIEDELMPMGQASYLNAIRAKLGWEITMGDADTKVAVVDTGIDELHPDFAGQIVSVDYCLGCRTGDSNGHGTGVAGVIGAENGKSGIVGIAADARLLIYKKGLFHGSDVIHGINDATKKGARVINISSGGLCLWSMRRAIDTAYAAGTIVIAAGGNDGLRLQKNDSCLLATGAYPASFTKVVAVGATDKSGRRASFSAYGNEVLFAPGASILTTTPGGKHDYMSGTSFAAPLVSGLAALIISQNPQLGASEVINILTDTADEMVGEEGYGRINVYRALKVAQGQLNPEEDPLPDAVSNLSAAVTEGSSPYVDLAWDPPADDYVGAHIYRKDLDDDEYRLWLDGGVIVGNSYRDSDVEPGRLYHYFVFAVDSLGQESIAYEVSDLVSVPYDWSSWMFEYRGEESGEIRSLHEMNNRGIIAAGRIRRTGAEDSDLWVLNLNPDGSVNWQHSFGGRWDETGYAIEPTSDDGFLVAAETISFGAGSSDLWLLKLDNAGQIVWQKTYGGSEWEDVFQVRILANGDYIVAGATRSFGQAFRSLWLARLDQSGGVIWNRAIGNGNSGGRDEAHSIQETTDGGFIVAGETYDPGTGTIADGWVLKLNSIGEVVWEKSFDHGGADWFDTVWQTSDGNYIVAGRTFASGVSGGDAWILKIDNAGRLIWQKRYVGAKSETIESIQELPNGDLIAAGDSTSFGESYDAWLMKLKPNGSIIWQKYYDSGGLDTALTVEPSIDGGFLVAGRSDGIPWVMRIAEDGTIPGCNVLKNSSARAISASGNSQSTHSINTTDVLSSRNTQATRADVATTQFPICYNLK